MNDFGAYLDAIALPAAARDRVIALVEVYGRLLDLDRAEIFVSDTLDGDGNRSYPELWIVTPSSLHEARLPGGQGDELDGVSLAGAVQHWTLRSSDFDYIAPGDASRLSVEVQFTDDLIATMHATGSNCARLLDLVQRFVVPNLRPTHG